MLQDNEYKVIGDDLQAVSIKLSEDQHVTADPGNLVYMSDNIEMNAVLGQGNTGQKVLNGLKRMITGEKFFLASFKAKSGIGEIVLSSPVPGKIIPVRLFDSGLICEKRSYLCSDSTVNIEATFARRIGAGLFGREGFILQKLTGTGMLFIQASGTVIKKELAEGEKLNLYPGCLVAFDTSIDYNIQYVGGLKTALFAGVGLFFVTLTGPGEVYIQTLPVYKLAKRLFIESRTFRGRSGD